ncbi:outer membrane protein assembly factor BamB [Fontibacillus phaseoli]|uniref:Outer membrane protein assembly factor BamB n=1 Tax=Fontibacillus phaseoli TaxID=1416533 RepID=A0A369B907_9BACL|nr:PQQ-binding-like beta-propeller repeat protein [Fontibacillus phaseoli]RCX17017.1 outer membrane protein assembly factor BamB [Fontibacillus phaseoli]
MKRKGTLMGWCAVLLLTAGVVSGCGGQPSARFQGSYPFRGDAANTGVYATKGLPRLNGEKWSLKLEAHIQSSPVLAEGTLYFGSEEGKFYAVDANDGTITWEAKFPGKIRSSAAVVEDELYFTDTTSTLYALERETGKLKWKQQLDDSLTDEGLPDMWDYYIGSPAVDGDYIYVGGEGPQFYAIKRQDGSVVWETETASFVHGKAAIADGNIHIADMSGEVAALDQQTGNKLWSAKFGPVQSSMTYKDGVLYFGSRDQYVYALDAESGAILWTHLSPSGSWVVSSAAASDKHVVIGASDSKVVHVFDRSAGKHKFDFKLDSRVFASPVITDQIMYFGSAYTDGGKERDAFYAVDLDSGEELWRFEGTKSPILSTPIVADGIVFFATLDGYVYALH